MNTNCPGSCVTEVIFPTDPPDGAPSCSIFPVNNYTDLALVCSWMGGYPPPNLNWSPYVNRDNPQGFANITQIQPGSETSNNSVFTCYGTHIALNVPQSCSTRTCEYGVSYVYVSCICVFNNMLHFQGLPYGEPQCFAYVTHKNEYLMLSCSWEGGVPGALLWWASSSGVIQGTSEENSNILVLRSSANYSSKTFICHAKHPLAKESKRCVLKLGKSWCSRGIFSVRLNQRCNRSFPVLLLDLTFSVNYIKSPSPA